MSRHASQLLQASLKAALSGKSLRKLCQEWGIDIEHIETISAAISRALNGYPLSLRAENELRRYLDLPELLEPILVDPCPDCGKVHVAGRCHGKRGQTIILAPDETVRRRPRRQTPPHLWPLVAGLLQAANQAGRLDESGHVILPGQISRSETLRRQNVSCRQGIDAEMQGRRGVQGRT